jgi:uncharacterized protein (TIGR03067 family)
VGELTTIAAVGLALGFIGLVVCLLLPGCPRRAAMPVKEDDAGAPRVPVAPREEDDAKKIQGDWRIAGMVADGDPVRVDGAEMLWRIQRENLIVQANGQELRFTYKLASDQKPKAIDVTAVDERGNRVGPTEHWVYELDGDTVRFCKPLDLNGPRPKEVASKRGSNTSLMEFKRQPPGPQKGGERK